VSFFPKSPGHLLKKKPTTFIDFALSKLSYFNLFAAAAAADFYEIQTIFFLSFFKIPLT
jgi:hypothetical protein